MRRNLHELSIRLNQLVKNSKKPLLIDSYGFIREFSNYSLSLPLGILSTAFKKKNKFFIYTVGRTGSTLLIDLLNSSPYIHCDREIFAFETIFTEHFLNAKRTIFNGFVYGCKILSGQLHRQVNRDGMRPFIQRMNEQGWKIIYLSRRNLVRHALSLLLVKRRRGRKVHQFKNDGSLKLNKVHIDCNLLKNSINSIQGLNARDEEVLRGIPHLKIVYEEDLLRSQSHRGTTDRIFHYLELEPTPVKTELIRITSDNLSDFIENYNEVKSSLNGTPYARYLTF